MSKVRIYQKPAGIPANTSVFAVEILQNNVWYTRKVPWETLKGLIAGAESLVFDAGTLTFTTPDGIAHQVLSVDSEVIPNSANPVSGGAVNTALAGKQDTLTFDQTPTDGSTNPVESNGIYDALAGKQNTLTFDNAPTDGSTNPVTSQGIYAAISAAISGLDWKEAVATYADIATTYPNPEDGWTVTTLDDDHTYRYNGTEWVDQFSLITLATSTKDGLMSSADFTKLAGIEAEANKTTDEDITDVVVDLTDMQQTASANPITLETKQAGLAKSCVVSFGPIQDLNGYSNPWAGGAGKNEYPLNSAPLTTTELTITPQTNGKFRIQANTTAQRSIAISTPTENLTLLPIGNHTISVDRQLPNGISLQLSGSNNNGMSYGIIQNTTTYITREVTDATKGFYYLTFVVPANVTADFEVGLQIEKGNSVTDFAPYSNICPISGRTEASVKRTGANQWDEQWENCSFNNTTGEKVSTQNCVGSKNPVRVFPSTAYYFKIADNSSDANVAVYEYDEDMNFLGKTIVRKTGTTNNPLTLKATTKYINFYWGTSATTGTYNNDFALNYPSTVTTYSAYQGETHNKEFGQTVYGGSLDFMNGELINEWNSVLVDLGDLTWSYTASGNRFTYSGLASVIKKPATDSTVADIISNQLKTLSLTDLRSSADNALIAVGDTGTISVRYTGSGTDPEQFKTDIAGTKIMFKLATPDTTIQLSPEAVTLLKGLNVISTDGDKVQVEFSDIPVGDYSVLLDYVKSLEARIQALEGGN